MQIKKLFLLLVVLTAFAEVPAQIKLLKATKQSWVGGQPGSSGINYAIDFDFKSKDSLILDSIYVHGQAFALVHSNSAVNTAYWYKHKQGKKRVLKIIVKEHSFMCDYPVYDRENNEPQKKPQVAIPSFNGEALLVYRLNKNKKTIVIKSFTALESINYP